jgi:hypothetical protein
MTTRRWATGMIVLDLCLLLCGLGATVVVAETRLLLGGGVTQFQRTTPDGTWWQADYPHEFELTSLGLKAGLEQRMGEHWFLGANYVRLGTARAWTHATSDAHYLAHDAMPPHYRLDTKDQVQGVEALGGYRWTQWPIQPYVSAGLAQFWHQATTDGRTWSGAIGHEEFDGRFLAARVGGGLCAGWICGDVTYYRGLQHGSGFPISTDALLSTAFVSVPLTGWGW